MLAVRVESSWRAESMEDIILLRIPNVVQRPGNRGRRRLSDHDCILETELGSANFGLDTQLKEVEQGFFDLLALRPVEAMNRALLLLYSHHLETGSTLRWSGRINQVVGNLIESDGPFCFRG